MSSDLRIYVWICIVVIFASMFLLGVCDGKDIVVVSFDGSKSLYMWHSTLEFAFKNDVKFTYFISAPYFMTRGQAKELGFKMSRMSADDFPIHWRGNGLVEEELIQSRVLWVKKAMNRGHEIGSHGVHHIKGHIWRYDEWYKEFEMFKKVMLYVTIDYSEIIGYRAPCFSHNKEMYEALIDYGFRYDTSFCSSKDWVVWQTPDFPMLPLPRIYPYTKNSVIAMDYNFWVKHERLKKCKPSHISKEKTDPKLIKQFEDNYFKALCDGYNSAIKKGRPFSVGNHFDLMHNGAYWRGLQRFILYAKKQGATFMTYKELYAHAQH
jgi:peptidoglycan/xylan/chitin deacetylase (PgdA/CDA1 family)